LRDSAMQVSISGLRLLVAASLLLGLTIDTVAAPRQFTADLVHGDRLRMSRYPEVVEFMLHAGPDDQARFAEIAIELMIAAYEAELQPDTDTRDRGAAEHAGWRAGTRNYIERLRRIGASIGARPPMDMIREPHGDVRLVIGNEQVMLSAPRLRDQAALERSVAEHVCRYAYCDNEEKTIEERVDTRVAEVGGAWAFSHNAQPVFESGDGLRCVFADRRHLTLKKNACINLVREIRLLAEALSALKANGVAVDWRSLKIEHGGSGNPQKLVYTADRRFVHMHVPNLLHADTVWRSAIPWIRAHVIGRAIQHVIDLPDQLAYLSPSALSDYETN